jgi:hypothetical protein
MKRGKRPKQAKASVSKGTKKAKVKKIVVKKKVEKKVGYVLVEALEILLDLAPGAVLRAKDAPAHAARTPWLMVGRFGLPGGTSYDELGGILTRWEASKRAERLIGADRLSRLQVKYTTERGQVGEYTLAEIAPWEAAISRAVERVMIRDNGRDSLVQRYGEGRTRQSDIDAVLVWFSATSVRNVASSPDFAFGGRGGVSNDEPIVELPWEELAPKSRTKKGRSRGR